MKLSKFLIPTFISIIFATPLIANQIRIPSGRTVFFQDEPILLQLTVTNPPATNVTLQATSSANSTPLSTSIDLVNGHGYLQLPATFLTGGKLAGDPRGEWTLTIPGASKTITIMDGIPNTPFSIAIYGGSVHPDEETGFGGIGPMKVSERQKLYRDTYGVNLIMNTGHWSGPATPQMVDRMAGANVRIAAQHIVAGQHQPGGISTSWADPGIQKATRLKLRYQTQLWRRVAGGALAAIHYADEPGLTWGAMSEDGTMSLLFSVPRTGYYVGPFAVPQQYEAYQQETGKTAPDFRQALSHWEQWKDFMLWRLGVFQKVFAQYTEDVHAIDPNLIGYSQVYAWRAVADGIYPPKMAKGLDVVASHGYGTWTYLGHMYPGHEVDAIRSGAWGKPLWFLGPWKGNQAAEGGVRAVIYGKLARKVEGIIWPLDWMREWPEATEVSQKILPISGALEASTKERDPIGLLHSVDQHIWIISGRVREKHPGRPYYGALLTAWWALQASGYPSTRVAEEDFANGMAREHDVIIAPMLTYVTPQFKQQIEDWIQQGGRFIIDAASTAEIEGAEKLSFEFVNGFDEAILPRIAPDVSANTQLAYETLIAPILPAFQETLANVPQPFRASSPHIMKGTADGGRDVRYFWAVNQANNKHLTLQYDPISLQAKLDFSTHEGVLYDVFAREPLSRLAFETNFIPGDGKLYALLPYAITKPQIVAKNTPGHIGIAAYFNSPQGNIQGVIPMTIEIRNPANELIFQGWRATGANGKYREYIPISRTAVPGTYTITVTENLTGLQSDIAVTRDIRTTDELKLPISGNIAIIDEANQLRFFAREGRIKILYGNAEQKAIGESLATQLQTVTQRPITLSAATNYTEKVVVDAFKGAHFDFFGGLYNTPTGIHEDTIILGNENDNEAMRRLVDEYRLVPFDLNQYGPQSNQAVIWWSNAAFGMENDTIAIYAPDSDSLENAIPQWLQSLQHP